MEHFSTQGLKPALRYMSSQLERILHVVRDNMLEWLLKLERQGVVGEGMSFSEEERKTAAGSGPITTYIQQVLNSQIRPRVRHFQGDRGQAVPAYIGA